MIYTTVVFILFFSQTLLSREAEKALKDLSSNKPLRVVKVVIENETFKPDVIAIDSKKPTIIEFMMKDNKLCKEKIIIKGLNLELPIILGEETSVTIKDKKPGRYHIECETGAFCGVLFIIGDQKDEPKHYYGPPEE